MSRLLGTQQAAVWLNVPLSTLRYWLVRGEAPPSFLLGRRRMFREDALEAFIEEAERTSATSAGLIEQI